jgi:diguanylate cyclase (GGDEF)-like protein
VKILLVDDDPSLLRLLRQWLQRAGYETQSVADGQAVVAAISASCPNLVITDWDMPEKDGVELCRWIRGQDTPHYVYTIFLTNRSDSEDMVEALEAGADDFIKKPVDRDEMLARVRSGTRVLELESRLNHLVKTDPLTGLITRRTFFEAMENEWERAARHFRPISCVMMDIDYFKRINDSYGHQAGDQALRTVAKILQENCRNTDWIGRYGGEEFCVLLPETTEEQATAWAERVRQAWAKRRDVIEDHDLGITASFGVAQRLVDTGSPEELIDLADQALLVAKRSGRDRVINFQTMHANEQIKDGPKGPESLFHDVVAKDVMATIVAGLDAQEPVGNAAQYFLKFRFSSAPVVDKDGKLLGILSVRDVMSIMLMPNWWKKSIHDVMKQNVVCYEEETSVLIIYEFLSRVSLRGVVVVRDGRPTGMIGRSSLLRWFTNRMMLFPKMGPEGVSSAPEESRCPAQPEVAADVPATATSSAQDNVRLLTKALAREAIDLENRLEVDSKEIVPILIGGVSRLEELINDLLSHSRFETMHDQSQIDEAPSPSTAQGLAAVLGAGAPADDIDPDVWLAQQLASADFGNAVE